MAMWHYRCYGTDASPNLWAEVYLGWQTDIQAKHDNAFETLEARLQWTEPHYKPLHGMGDLGEVRINGSGGAWRIFGFRRHFGEERTFVITHIGSKKGSVYSPKNVMKEARSRMDEIGKDPTKAISCQRPRRSGSV